MSMWSPRIDTNARVKYIGIVEAIEADIKNRLLKPGDRLPAQRQIADSLSVDLTTVTRAINEAARRGLVETQRGNGCFIAQTTFSHYNSSQLIEGKPLDLSMNNPPIPSGLNLEKKVAEAISELSLSGISVSHHLCYQETAGHPDDREAGQQWLSSKLTDLNSDQLLISSGAHSALFCLLSYLKRRGAKTVAAPEFSYPGLRAMAEQLQLDVVGISMDEQGIIPEQLQLQCAKQTIDILYVIPNIDNPTTATLSAQRRESLIVLANQYDLTIIEDDPYYQFVDEKLPSLFNMARDRTWHIATISKCLSPSLRVAYIASPNINDALGLTEEMRISHLMAPPLMTAVVSHWIRHHKIDEITQAIKTENIRRQSLAQSIFQQSDISSHPASPHLWLRMPHGYKALDFAEQASRIGVSIVPSTAFVMFRSRSQAVRISLGASSDYESLKQGLTLLSDLYRPGLIRSKTIV
ncbi:transcriptional regulator containing a DNA-binding HTH domain and an aminotransferase domain containing protein [Methylophaga aminisulfidivorans MP]|uniref:Transcriptional regulator containing a DNA-binding HTH domain and an aminotransferase domain containing protein n=1 Tax=Methylophaga aminisulfidivorans MP TaxID=1026882 RepID=F5SXN6_9GAMM|nr:PLP-dependent aminotransferase family protein [Methylophaga aminisulfidivorans]EGL55233.1 transcriptional regulator containing a DNA-binding HTH domain and an aminotransferase domain containing protein [Methylophaga aminisulfidivorans MP]